MKDAMGNFVNRFQKWHTYLLLSSHWQDSVIQQCLTTRATGKWSLSVFPVKSYLAINRQSLAHIGCVEYVSICIDPSQRCGNIQHVSSKDFFSLTIPLNICLDDLKNSLYCHLTFYFSVSFIESVPSEITFFFFLDREHSVCIRQQSSDPVLVREEVQRNGAFHLLRAPHQEGQGAWSGDVCGSFQPLGRPQSFNPDQNRKMECSWEDVSQKKDQNRIPQMMELWKELKITLRNILREKQDNEHIKKKKAV